MRLDLIKNMKTPAYSLSHGCADPDCLHLAAQRPCLGNRLVLQSLGGEPSWLYNHGKEGLSLYIEHGKNDRRESKEMYKVSFRVPEGKLTKLLLAHVHEGQHLLTQHLPDPQHNLFVLGSGNSFNNVTFTQYWGKVMRHAQAKYGLSYFAPSLARTIFIEDFVAAHGSEPDLIEGAAVIMGNTAAQWQKSYNPSRKRRAAAAAVAQHGEATRWMGQEEQGTSGHGAGSST